MDSPRTPLGFAEFVEYATGKDFDEGTRFEFTATASASFGPLAQALHEVGGEFCQPFTDDHPVGMHNSQAAALLSVLARLQSTDPSLSPEVEER